MYARQLDDARFEAFLSFIQSLTEAAKMSPGVLIVGSLPESDAEAGGERGRAALRRLEQVFGRVQSPWLPASGNETYEIIRRRLFQPLDAEGEKARDETVKAFHDLYKKNPAEFPPEAKEVRYLELLRLSYPIHPELFDRLSKDWASLEKFQRTRGVLRFMANVIGVLWQGQARSVRRCRRRRASRKDGRSLAQARHSRCGRRSPSSCRPWQRGFQGWRRRNRRRPTRPQVRQPALAAGARLYPAGPPLREQRHRPF